MPVVSRYGLNKLPRQLTGREAVPSTRLLIKTVNLAVYSLIGIYMETKGMVQKQARPQGQENAH